MRFSDWIFVLFSLWLTKMNWYYINLIVWIIYCENKNFYGLNALKLLIWIWCYAFTDLWNVVLKNYLILINLLLILLNNAHIYSIYEIKLTEFFIMNLISNSGYSLDYEHLHIIYNINFKPLSSSLAIITYLTKFLPFRSCLTLTCSLW